MSTRKSFTETLSHNTQTASCHTCQAFFVLVGPDRVESTLASFWDIAIRTSTAGTLGKGSSLIAPSRPTDTQCNTWGDSCGQATGPLVQGRPLCARREKHRGNCTGTEEEPQGRTKGERAARGQPGAVPMTLEGHDLAAMSRVALERHPANARNGGGEPQFMAQAAITCAPTGANIRQGVASDRRRLAWAVLGPSLH
uniref:Uncharacterized protein n=1 Tax=Eutreptiella gymnastica TaxID=73025 RepID=A0A7S4CIR5_9EUGL